MKTKTARDSMKVKIDKIARMVATYGAVSESTIITEFDIAPSTWYGWRKLLLQKFPKLRYDRNIGTIAVPEGDVKDIIPNTETFSP